MPPKSGKKPKSTRSKKTGAGKSRKSRTLLRRAKEIFHHIEMQSEPFPKSEFSEIGLNPSAAEKWLELIDFIQSQPRIKITRMGSSTFVEKLENKHLTMLRKRILDSSLTLKEREATIDDYLSVLSTLERTENMRIGK